MIYDVRQHKERLKYVESPPTTRPWNLRTFGADFSATLGRCQAKQNQFSQTWFSTLRIHRDTFKMFQPFKDHPPMWKSMTSWSLLSDIAFDCSLFVCSSIAWKLFTPLGDLEEGAHTDAHPSLRTWWLWCLAQAHHYSILQHKLKAMQP